MDHFTIILFVLTSTPDGSLQAYPLLNYGASPSSMTACKLEADSRNKTLVQRYKFTCLKEPDIEI